MVLFVGLEEEGVLLDLGISEYVLVDLVGTVGGRCGFDLGGGEGLPVGAGEGLQL